MLKKVEIIFTTCKTILYSNVYKIIQNWYTNSKILITHPNLIIEYEVMYEILNIANSNMKSVKVIKILSNS